MDDPSNQATGEVQARARPEPGNRAPQQHRDKRGSSQPFAYVSRPRIGREIRLNTGRAQHLYLRQFPAVNRALHYLTADLPSILYSTQRFSSLDQQRFFNTIEDKLREIFQAVAEAFDGEIARLRGMCEQHGIAIPDYTGPLVTDARISSRSSNQLVELVSNLDEILMLLDAVWIAGLHGDREHNLVRRHYYKTLYRLTNQVTDLAKRGRACYRFGHVELFPENEALPREDEDHPELHAGDFQLEPDEQEIIDGADGRAPDHDEPGLAGGADSGMPAEALRVLHEQNAAGSGRHDETGAKPLDRIDRRQPLPAQEVARVVIG